MCILSHSFYLKIETPILGVCFCFSNENVLLFCSLFLEWKLYSIRQWAMNFQIPSSTGLFQDDSCFHFITLQTLHCMMESLAIQRGNVSFRWCFRSSCFESSSFIYLWWWWNYRNNKMFTKLVMKCVLKRKVWKSWKLFQIYKFIYHSFQNAIPNMYHLIKCY